MNPARTRRDSAQRQSQQRPDCPRENGRGQTPDVARDQQTHGKGQAHHADDAALRVAVPAGVNGDGCAAIRALLDVADDRP